MGQRRWLESAFHCIITFLLYFILGKGKVETPLRRHLLQSLHAEDGPDSKDVLRGAYFLHHFFLKGSVEEICRMWSMQQD